MEARPESQVPAQASPMPAQPASLAGPTAAAIGQVLASTETEIDAIKARTEREVWQISADLQMRSMEEAAERRMRLERVRHELADRASALLVAYEGINQRLEEIDAALAGMAEQYPGRVTVRERQRISVPYDEALLTPQPQQAPPPPPVALARQRSGRRWWLPWQREAA